MRFLLPLLLAGCAVDVVFPEDEIESLDAEADSMGGRRPVVRPTRFDPDGDGYTRREGDCDNADASVYPGAPDARADGKDNDCDGLVDEDNTSDDDGDGYSEADGDCDDGNARVHPRADDDQGDGVDNDCDGTADEDYVRGTDADGDGWSIEAGDCDDANPAIYPGAAERRDGVDNDCDGVVDR